MFFQRFWYKLEKRKEKKKEKRKKKSELYSFIIKDIAQPFPNIRHVFLLMMSEIFSWHMKKKDFDLRRKILIRKRKKSLESVNIYLLQISKRLTLKVVCVCVRVALFFSFFFFFTFKISNTMFFYSCPSLIFIC